MEVSTTNYLLPKSLPTTEQQGPLPYASVETEPCAAAGLQHPCRLWGSGGVRHSVLQGIPWNWSLGS